MAELCGAAAAAALIRRWLRKALTFVTSQLVPHPHAPSATDCDDVAATAMLFGGVLPERGVTPQATLQHLIKVRIWRKEYQQRIAVVCSPLRTGHQSCCANQVYCLGAHVRNM